MAGLANFRPLGPRTHTTMQGTTRCSEVVLGAQPGRGWGW